MTFLSKPFYKILFILVLLSSWCQFSRADEMKIVATIPALHSIVAALTMGVTSPVLLLPGNVSPHHISLRPSDIRKISEADLIIQISPQLETGLVKSLSHIESGKIMSMLDIAGLSLLNFRAGADWADHDHDHGGHGKHDDHEDHAHKAHKGHDHEDHAHKAHKGHDDHEDHAHKAHKGHDDHDDHAHKAHKGHDDHDDHAHKAHKGHDDHEDHAHKAHKGHDDHDDHAHKAHDENPSETDVHIWLSPTNAGIMAKAIHAKILAMRPEHKDQLDANLTAFSARLTREIAKLKEIASDLSGHRFITFHDAFQYLEKEFNLNAAGSVTLNPEIRPGARRLKEIQETIQRLNITCIMSEPQFSPRYVAVLAEKLNVNVGVLDPVGADIPPGPDLYFQLIETNLKILKLACLKV